MASKGRREIQVADLDMGTLVPQVHRVHLDLLDLLFPSTDLEDMTVPPGITLVLKERKVIVEHRGHLDYQAPQQTLIFTL